MVTLICDTLSSMDSSLLLAINGHHNAVLDSIMYTASNKLIWIPMYMMLFFVVIKDLGLRKATVWLLFLILAITISDQITSGILKPLVGRLRPSNLDNPISEYIHIVYGYRGGSHGFASSHAANSFCLAFYWIFTKQRKFIGYVLVTWSLIICYSRIYLGVHYPGDVATGIAIGIFCARNTADIRIHSSLTKHYVSSSMKKKRQSYSKIMNR